MKPQLKTIPLSRPKEKLLEIKNLGKVFHLDHSFLSVLEGITFDIRRSEMICILGRSGCGKSTLLKIIAGFLKPSTGEVLLDGKPVLKPGPDRCVVFQEDTLFPWLTIRENIEFGLKGLVQDKRQIKRDLEEFLGLVGLKEFSNYLPREISGGMKQRVALARVLILRPRVLLMDEPFASLDAQTREEMQDLLLSLWKTFSHTVIFVTHDVTEAILLADRVLLMGNNPGRIRKEIPVTLPRPRERDNQPFISLTRHLYGELRD